VEAIRDEGLVGRSVCVEAGDKPINVITPTCDLRTKDNDFLIGLESHISAQDLKIVAHGKCGDAVFTKGCVEGTVAQIADEGIVIAGGCTCDDDLPILLNGKITGAEFFQPDDQPAITKTTVHCPIAGITDDHWLADGIHHGRSERVDFAAIRRQGKAIARIGGTAEVGNDYAARAEGEIQGSVGGQRKGGNYKRRKNGDYQRKTTLTIQ